MKKKLKLSTLILGIVVAVIALANTSSYADKLENNAITELTIQEAELFELMEQILEEKNTEQEQEKYMRFYNTKKQLVYESRDKDDAHLKILLRRSDLVLQTDSSSYYLLGD